MRRRPAPTPALSQGTRNGLAVATLWTVLHLVLWGIGGWQVAPRTTARETFWPLPSQYDRDALNWNINHYDATELLAYAGGAWAILAAVILLRPRPEPPNESNP